MIHYHHHKQVCTSLKHKVTTASKLLMILPWVFCICMCVHVCLYIHTQTHYSSLVLELAPTFVGNMCRLDRELQRLHWIAHFWNLIAVLGLCILLQPSRFWYNSNFTDTVWDIYFHLMSAWCWPHLVIPQEHHAVVFLVFVTFLNTKASLPYFKVVFVDTLHIHISGSATICLSKFLLALQFIFILRLQIYFHISSVVWDQVSKILKSLYSFNIIV